jgi:hypothetical protein
VYAILAADLKATFQLQILGVKKNPQSPMYTQLGVLTKGTIIEVNVSELGLVTTGGKVVFGKYAQITNNPENDGCINAVLRECFPPTPTSPLLTLVTSRLIVLHTATPAYLHPLLPHAHRMPCASSFFLSHSCSSHVVPLVFHLAALFLVFLHSG